MERRKKVKDFTELAREHNEEIKRRLDLNNDGEISHTELGQSADTEITDVEDHTIVLF